MFNPALQPCFFAPEDVGVDRSASVAESVHRPPSSYTSSVTHVEELPPGIYQPLVSLCKIKSDEAIMCKIIMVSDCVQN